MLFVSLIQFTFVPFYVKELLNLNVDVAKPFFAK